MIEIDKNDVDISKLFQWKKTGIILGEGGKELLEVHMRLAGDADLNRSRVFALRESAKLRQDLSKEDTDMRLAYIISKELVTEESLRNMIIGFSSREISQEALEEIDIPLPKEPKDGAKLEEQEAYQKEVDDYPKKKLTKINEFVSKRIDQLDSEMKSWDIDKLYKEYINKAIRLICESRMLEAFKDMCIYLSSFSDETYKVKLFKDFEEFDNLPTEIKLQFRNIYTNLELGIDDLKK
jgi:hypothetical protein